jgi:hypothetical protein
MGERSFSRILVGKRGNTFESRWLYKMLLATKELFITVSYVCELATYDSRGSNKVTSTAIFSYMIRYPQENHPNVLLN